MYKYIHLCRLCTCIRRVKYTMEETKCYLPPYLTFTRGDFYFFCLFVFGFFVCFLFVFLYTPVMNHKLFLKARQIYKEEIVLKSRIPAKFASSKLAFHADNAKGLENIASLLWGMLAARSEYNSSLSPVLRKYMTKPELQLYRGNI